MGWAVLTGATEGAEAEKSPAKVEWGVHSTAHFTENGLRLMAVHDWIRRKAAECDGFHTIVCEEASMGAGDRSRSAQFANKLLGIIEFTATVIGARLTLVHPKSLKKHAGDGAADKEKMVRLCNEKLSEKYGLGKIPLDYHDAADAAWLLDWAITNDTMVRWQVEGKLP